MEASVLVATENGSQDIEDPRCARHWNTAVGVVTWETSDDRERRELFCPSCAWDVLSAAMLSDPFTPPMVSPLNLDAERPWIAGAVAS